MGAVSTTLGVSASWGEDCCPPRIPTTRGRRAGLRATDAADNDAANRPPKRAGAEKEDDITADDERRATATHATLGIGDFMVQCLREEP